MDIHSDKVDLDRQILKPMAGSGQLYIYQSSEYVEDMGTPARYEKVCKAYQTGIVQARNLHNKQKAIFLDRDGTINKYVGYLSQKNLNYCRALLKPSVKLIIPAIWRLLSPISRVLPRAGLRK